MTLLKFYRSMGYLEYLLHKDLGRITQTEWAEPTIERKSDGIPISRLIGWVDAGRSPAGKHDLIIQVEGAVPEEFELNEFTVPGRYKSIKSIDFDRAKIVYDPRGVVSGDPINILKEMWYPNSMKNIILGYLSGKYKLIKSHINNQHI